MIFLLVLELLFDSWSRQADHILFVIHLVERVMLPSSADAL